MGSQVTENGNEVKTVVSLADAKSYLQRNDLSEIAKEERLTRSQVSNVLHGRSKNFRVMEKIIQRAKHNKAIVDSANSITE